MMLFSAVKVMLVFLPLFRCEMKVVDLTWTLGPDTVYWTSNQVFNFTILSRGNTSRYWYESNWFSTAEHGGTHLDSPSHFFKDSWRIHEIPPGRLIGPAVVIDVRSKVTIDSDYRVEQEDLEAYERRYGVIPNGAIVIMNSGWDSRYPDRKRVFNSDQPDAPSTFHFPGFHEDSVAWLVANRNISIIGVDTPSVDYGQSTGFKVHVINGRNNIPGLENVANLAKIPANGALITVGAVKLFDGSGAPARILATFDPDAKPCHCGTSSGVSATGALLLDTVIIASIVLFCRQ